MEENKVTKAHKIILGNRKNGSITGVLDVISFDITEVLLETEQGMLNLKGKDLHINRLNLEKGEVDIDGKTDSFVYSERNMHKKEGDSLWKKLFR